LAELTSERIFNLHPKIRWAGLANDKGEVLFAKMRPGVQSLSPEAADISFMQLGPMLLSSVCERLAAWAGRVESVVTTYERVVLVVVKLDEHHLAFTVNRQDVDLLPQIIGSVFKAKLT
jgi:hypothetical protein